MDGWKEGRKEAKAGLRIAYSNQKPLKLLFIRVFRSDQPGREISLQGEGYYTTCAVINQL